MGGASVDWYKLAYRHGFREPHTMMVEMRQKGLTYQEIAYDLGCTRANVRFKCYEWLALGKVTAEQILMEDKDAKKILKDLPTKYPWIAEKVRQLGGRI